MLNVGKLNDAYRLLQTLLNASVIEKQQTVTDEESENTNQNINSILEDDNALEQIKFTGAISEKKELKKLLGKRSRHISKAEHLQISKRPATPNVIDINYEDVRGKLLTAFVEACQSMDPTPANVMNLFKVVLKKI